MFELLNKLGVGSMGGVIILTRGMGERLTYGIPARYRVVLMGKELLLERYSYMLSEKSSLCVGA